MHVYFSGIGGAGIGPLALLAKDCGYDISGSDLNQSSFTDKLTTSGVEINIGTQDGQHLKQIHESSPIDWFVYTAALPTDHAELIAAKSVGIRTSKRDEFINQVIIDKNLKLIAVSGTHGKTTATAMLVWLFHALSMPVSYQIGTNVSWGPSAKYEPNSEYFIYEADEYDRNMLKFKPDLAIIPSLDYDHPDVYLTQADYDQAFRDFAKQSQTLLTWDSIKTTINLENTESFADNTDVSNINLPGIHSRQNAYLVINAFKKLYPQVSETDLLGAISQFPGTERRFEKLADNLYTDYAHHPSELKATIQMARELSDEVIVVYQPHQDKRQREIAEQYRDVFAEASKVYWLPTYNPSGRDTQQALTPDELIANLANPGVAEVSEMNDHLQHEIARHLADNQLVVACSAGTLDNWLRQSF